MQLDRFVSGVQRDLAAAIPAESPAAEHAERVATALDSSLRLAIIQAVSTAADELSTDVAPGSVSLSIRGGEPRLEAHGLTPTATLASAETAGPDEAGAPAQPEPPASFTEADAGETSRINLRLPETLKVLAETAAQAAGQSMNAWLVRTVATAVSQAGAGQSASFTQNPGPAGKGQRPSSARAQGRRVTGWMN